MLLNVISLSLPLSLSLSPSLSLPLSLSSSLSLPLSLPLSLSRLQEMLECGEDLEVDIPKVWDFFAEIVAPLVSSSNLPLNDYVKLLRDVNIERRKLSRNVARLVSAG